MAGDEKLAAELAEMARHFVLWLQENDLPDVPGLKGSSFDLFYFYAGTYQRYLDGGMSPLSPTFLEEAAEEDRKRLDRFSLGARNLLLMTNPSEVVETQAGEPIHPNRIVRDGKIPFDRPGGLKVIAPRLMTLKASAQNLGLYKHRDFCSIRHRIDLAWDDADAARRAGFRYLSIFDQTATPRAAWQVNVADVPVPEEVFRQGKADLRLANGGEALIAKRTRAYREYLLHNATYRQGAKFGAYYNKWLTQAPRAADREFRPTKLSDWYLIDNFSQNNPRAGDDLLLIDLGPAFFVYRLFWSPAKGHPQAKFMVERQFGSVSERLRTWPPKSARDAPWLEDGVSAYVFRAIDGARDRPNERRRPILKDASVTERYMVDYHAYVRWYYGDHTPSGLKLDQQWLHRFLATFFPDQTYLCTMPAVTTVDRDELFLNELKQREQQTPEGPLRQRITELVKWSEDPRNFIFTQGMKMAQGASQFIGVYGSPAEVFEWNPEKGIVTRTLLTNWLDQFTMGKFSREVYENTAGVIPLVGLVFAAALTPFVVLLGMSVAPVTLSTMARSAIVRLVEQTTTKEVSKAAIKKLLPELIALLVEGVMRLLPSSDMLLYRFLRGVVSGLGSGALTHYLTEFDERLKRQIDKIPAAIGYLASPTGYRIYQGYTILDKLTAAYVRLSALYDGLKTVWTAELPTKIAAQLSRLSRVLGVAFLILLFVAIYFYEVSTSQVEADRLKAKSWVEQQKLALQHMIRETGDEIVAYANKLRGLIALAKRENREVKQEELDAHDAELAEAVKASLAKAVSGVSGVGEFLALLLSEMGIDNWDELKKLGLGELLAKGYEALPLDALGPDALEKLGAALGELLGTILMERSIVPEKVKKSSGPLLGKPTHQVAKGALAGGTLRAVLHFLVQPFADLEKLPGKLKEAMKESASKVQSQNPQQYAFEGFKARDTSFLQFAQEVFLHHESISQRLLKLAEDDRLELELQTLIASAASKPPPGFDKLAGDDPEWPANAIVFVLSSWLKVGLRELGGLFVMIEDAAPFGGQFSLSKLLDLIGLDIPLDDQTVEALRATFEPAKS